MPKFTKGSDEAKAYMADLRAKRKPKVPVESPPVVEAPVVEVSAPVVEVSAPVVEAAPCLCEEKKPKKTKKLRKISTKENIVII